MIYDIMAVIMAAISAAITQMTPPAPELPAAEAEEGGGSDPDDSPDEAVAPPPPSLGDMALNLLKGMAPTVKVHQRWIGQAGISIQHLPGIFLHALPAVVPMASSEMWMGSATVLADGGPCSAQFHPALSCNLIGIPSIFRKTKPPKPKVSLMAPLAILTTVIPGGKPVLVGGPPTIDLFQLGMKLGLKGLGKVMKVAGKFIKKASKKAGGKLKTILQHAKCRVFGEPVDVATGRVYHTNTDFELPGPIPLVWERKYYSDAEIDGPLGYNWHHSYNMGIYDMGDSFTLRLPDGRETALPYLIPGEPGYYDRKEQLAWRRSEDGYGYSLEMEGLFYTFGSAKNREGYQMLSEIATRDGFRIKFRYNSRGDLYEITDSRNRLLLVDTDRKGHITCISARNGGERIDLIRYRYDDAGNMVETIDANGVSKRFEYSGHLLSKLTNQSGMSFYWEYEGMGDNARCVHTWGDNGVHDRVLEYRFEYGEGVTHVTDVLGNKEEYRYDENKLIYRIIDAGGGVTHQLYNSFQELEVVVNPEGLATKTVFNEYGKVMQSIDENGHATNYSYDKQLNLTQVITPGGMALSRKYDRFGRVTERTNATGETFLYGYEGRHLKTVTDRATVLYWNTTTGTT
jgi:YD repeat-containing protein